jgi:hypothetical protein
MDHEHEDEQPEQPRCPPHYCDNQGLCHYCGMVMEPDWWAAYTGGTDSDS